MAKFEVVYRIEVEAMDDLGAAYEAEYILNHMAFRPCFEVKKLEKNEIRIIDLEKMGR